MQEATRSLINSRLEELEVQIQGAAKSDLVQLWEQFNASIKREVKEFQVTAKRKMTSGVPTQDQSAYQLVVLNDRFGYSNNQDVNPSDGPQNGLPVYISKDVWGTSRRKSNPSTQCTHGAFRQCLKSQERAKSGMLSTKTPIHAMT
ncbi:unnamed protein product [Phytophthora fragariaefolia]|uniref:Unnamed protein product n=1 Tax=Phytophthora fragariaefolia TaxID=1490495 RepID=A0A9W6WVM1_9STRA|nr:unnamed protein product [Phytophthora fragariaefolia]